MKKVRFGIIGCGKIAQKNHIPGLLTNAKDAEIVAMYDIKPGKAEALAEQYGLKVKFYKSEKAILAAPDVDAVIIATPNSCHYPQTIHALKAGKHVLVEKPMSYTPEQADEMIDLSLKQGLVLQVNQSMRFNRLMNGVHDLVAGGLLGDVINFRCQRANDSTPNKRWSIGADWFVDPKFEGSLVGDIAVHMADLLQWTVGPVKRIMAITRKRDHKVEDNVVALLDFANGATGILEQSWTYPSGFWAQEIYGTKGTLRTISGGYEFLPAGSETASTVYSAASFPEQPNSQACFIKAIRTGDKTAWTAGRQAIALVTAIRDSNASGKAEAPRNRVEKKAVKKTASAKKAAPAKKSAAKPAAKKAAAPAKKAAPARKTAKKK